MGFSSYSVDSRVASGRSALYRSQSIDQTFVQQKHKRIHESMDPKGVALRECRDSEAHPNTVPIQLYLDVTGSMGRIPHHLIKEGLPHLVSSLIEGAAPDAALLFGAIGDHECDRHPLQIGQFESGDEELDMWLTRTYLEGGGGGNAGESYLLAWLFAAYHTVTDSFEKRGKKGFVFTVGDEPFLPSLPLSAAKEILGDTCKLQDKVTAQELYDEVCKTNHAFHIFVRHGMRYFNDEWAELMGDRCIIIDDYTKVPDTIIGIVHDVLAREGSQGIHIPASSEQAAPSENTGSPVEDML